jgi:hypothetical protein
LQRSLILGTAVLLWMASGAPVRAQHEHHHSQPAEPTQPSASPAESIVTMLSADDKQVERLDGLYEKFARTRLEQEAKMAAWHDTRKQAQAAGNARAADQAERDIKKAEQKIADAFQKSRADALKALTPEQRGQLETLSSSPKAALNDRHRQLLALKPGDLWQVPVEDATARRLLDSRAYAARSPGEYRYYAAPYSFRSYGYGLEGRPFFKEDNADPHQGHHGGGGGNQGGGHHHGGGCGGGGC